jgi:hypothetical protein
VNLYHPIVKIDGLIQKIWEHLECYILIQSEACKDHKRACYMDKLDLNWVISLDINKSGKMERTIVLRKNK